MFEVGKVYVGIDSYGFGYDHYEYAYYIRVVRVTASNVWFRIGRVPKVIGGKEFKDLEDPKNIGNHGIGLHTGEIIRKKLHHSNEFGDFITLDNNCSVWAKDEVKEVDY